MEFALNVCYFATPCFVPSHKCGCFCRKQMTFFMKYFTTEGCHPMSRFFRLPKFKMGDGCE